MRHRLNEADWFELGRRVMFRLESLQRDLRWFAGLDWRGHQ